MPRSALVRRHHDQLLTVRSRAGVLVGQAWDRYGGPGDGNIDAFTPLAASVVGGAQRRTIALAGAYIGAMVGGRPGVTVPIDTQAVLDGTRNGVDLATVYTRPVITMRTLLAGGAVFAEALAQARNRAVVAAMTDVMLANRDAATAAMTAEPRIARFERVLSPTACDLCAAASGEVYAADDPMPMHANCIPTGSVVATPPRLGGVPSLCGAVDGAIALTRRKYAGELVVIRTASGDEVSVTPNHPVLTEQGWLPAHVLCEGDYLLRNRAGHRTVGGRPHERHSPALVENVWSALAVKGTVSVPLATEDFHGDGGDGKVDVVRPHRNLSPEWHTEPVRELCLVTGHHRRASLPGAGPLHLLLQGVNTTDRSSMGGLRLAPTLGRRHLPGSHKASVPPVPRFDPPPGQFGLQGVPAYAERGLNLIGRLTGHVEPDRIVQLRRVGFRGHVYNLHTSEGWYSANGHIVSNCDCDVAPIVDGDNPAAGINDDVLASDPNVVDEVTDPEGDTRPLEVKVEQHGELGPVLVDAAHHFADI